MTFRLDLRPFSLPLAAPLRTATGQIDSRDGLLVRIERNGVVGVGEATPLSGWTETYDQCVDALERAVEAAEEGESAVLTAVEDSPAARHAVSLALLDARARQADEPLFRHLGGPERVESVPVNATLGDAASDETARAAAAAVDAGFDCLKVKGGARSVGADVDRLRAVRKAVGPDVELRADANGAWSRSEAREAFDAFESVGVSYVEQPLSAGDLSGHAALRGGTVKVALDETLATHSIDIVLDAEAADVLVIKPMALGGVDRARDVALRVLDAGLLPVVTTTIGGVVARTAAVHLAASLADPPACGLATAGLLETDLAFDPAPVSNGRIAVPQEKGHGAGAAWSER